MRVYLELNPEAREYTSCACGMPDTHQIVFVQSEYQRSVMRVCMECAKGLRASIHDAIDKPVAVVGEVCPGCGGRIQFNIDGYSPEAKADFTKDRVGTCSHCGATVGRCVDPNRYVDLSKLVGGKAERYFDLTYHGPKQDQHRVHGWMDRAGRLVQIG